jgi:pimeloyl-ACP methyl ester carboxylesterase
MTTTHHDRARTTGAARRTKVHFSSGDATCAAWHYQGSNGGCVVMAGGFAVTKEAATDLFARRFSDAGFSVLAFDYRHLGESGGQPRQVVRIAEQLADWDAAIAFASTLPGVDPSKLALWAFSVSGGHVVRVAAAHPQLAAVVAQTPVTDGRAATVSAVRFTTPMALLRLTGRGVVDAIGSLLRRPPVLVPLSGPRGSVAVLSTPDVEDGDRALNPPGSSPWPQEVAARSALRIGSYRPGRAARRVACPLLVVVCDDDRAAPAAPAVRAAEAAPLGEVVRLPGRHYAPFLERHEEVVEAELSFLRRHLIGDGPDRP